MLNKFLLIGLTLSTASAGPDLICSEINGATNYGFSNGKVAYSFGTTVCNIGDAPNEWVFDTNAHPLFSQTLYKLKDGALTQIGIGFVRNGLPPLASNACGLECTPAGINALGAGCSNTNSSSINGSQTLMGPRTEVNAFTGDFPYPFTSINQPGEATYKRLQVDLADVSDPDALYFVETQIISSAETDQANRTNNASYRQVIFSPGSANASLVGPTYAQQPAIFAMRDHGNGIGVPNPSVLINQKNIPDDGIIHVATGITELDDGTWRYNYAVHNQNTQRGIGSIMIPIGFNQSATSRAFNDVDYHDDLDELIDGTDWAQGQFDPDGEWHTIETYETNPLGNAIRWGTTYSFSFVSDYEPMNKAMLVRFFAPGGTDGPDSMTIGIMGPINPCIPNIDSDPALNFFDITQFVSAFMQMDLNVDFNGDGMLNFFDLSIYIQAFHAGCP
jgi:hypothetical protein